DKIREAEKRGAGMVDPFAAHRKRPLAEHLAVWRGVLASESSESQANMVATRTRKVLDGCRVETFADLAGGDFAAAVPTFLADLGRDSAPVELPPDKQEWSVGELSKLFGIHRASVSTYVRRHRLAVTGSTRTRRYPRATVEAIAREAARGCSIQMAN